MISMLLWQAMGMNWHCQLAHAGGTLQQQQRVLHLKSSRVVPRTSSLLAWRFSCVLPRMWSEKAEEPLASGSW